MGRDKALGDAVPRETRDYLRQQGLVWNGLLECFLASDWRGIRQAEGGWVAHGNFAQKYRSPPFPTPIAAFVHAEVCSWAQEENTL